MDILYAAAAFAVLMIVFSTAVTGLTESYLRITSIRAKVLARSVLRFLRTDPTIERFQKDIVDTIVPKSLEDKIKNVDVDETLKGIDRLIVLASFENNARNLAGAAQEAEQKLKNSKANNQKAKLTEQAKAAEAEAVKATRALETAQRKLPEPKRASALDPADTSGPVSANDSLPRLLAYNGLTENQSLNTSYGFAHAFLTGVRNKVTALTGFKDDVKRVEKLSTYSFLQRLAQTDIGKEIAKSGEEAALRSLTMGFERYVAASNEVFRKHAQTTTMILSILFAFAVNVDAFRVFNHLADNPQLSQALIDKGEEYAEANQVALTKFEAQLSSLEGTIDAVDPTEAEVKTALDEVKSAINEARDAATSGTDLREELTEAKDLPIGWDTYPYGQEATCVVDGEITCKSYTNTGFLGLVGWVFGTLLAGFLIGLGGPFWYKVFSSLSALLQVVRGLQGNARKEAIEAETSDEQAASQQLVDVVAMGDGVKDGDLMKIFQDSTGLPPSDFGAQNAP
ncbi:MAG: hypothetical protein AAF754_12420 [Pseudomonadota bacterium]